MWKGIQMGRRRQTADLMKKKGNNEKYQTKEVEKEKYGVGESTISTRVN